MAQIPNIMVGLAVVGARANPLDEVGFLYIFRLAVGPGQVTRLRRFRRAVSSAG
jgi:hypothetical protein